MPRLNAKVLGLLNDIQKTIAFEADSSDSNSTWYASMPWVDFRAFVGEPGLEHREKLSCFVPAARQGGFHVVQVSPDLIPELDNRSSVESFYARTQNLPLRFFCMGTVSKSMKGTELSEMMDMHEAGANVFYDGPRHLSADLLKKALLYTQSFGGLIVHMPFEPSLVKKEFVNEGEYALSVGMKGISDIAESIIVARDLQILEDVGGKLHFANITTQKSVDLIRQAKNKGLQVTADTAIHYLILDDSTTAYLDAHYKVFPPFRSKNDVLALQQAVVEGVIDVICSDHMPQSIETKEVELEQASFGISTIDLFARLYATHLSEIIPVEVFIQCVSENPARILGVSFSKEHEEFDPTIFSLDFPAQRVKKEDLFSFSKNTPFIGKELKGKVK